MNSYQSWGKYPKAKQDVAHFNYLCDALPTNLNGTLLPYGLGRSYGDSCLNDGNNLIDVSGLNRLIYFDETSGILRTEAGISLADILSVFVPRGWFLPVSPGTKFVTVGGAIANDIHGKNHHCAGTFGCHVRRFELLRSDGQRLICSPENNPELFRATIGGLGLTGLITWAEFQMKPIRSGYLEVADVKFRNLPEFFELSAEYERKYEFTVSWVDCSSQGSKMGRGILMAGNFSDKEASSLPPVPKSRKLPFPFEAPDFVLNKFVVRAFNSLYYRRQFQKEVKKISYYEPFFYPLDAILNWNRLYGKRGFFQYQLVVPYENDTKAIETIFKIISASKMASFLAVLKTFGKIRSPGMLTFSRPGVTLALDFPNDGKQTLDLLERLDEVVKGSGGCCYPAKDARMSPESFRTYFPNYKEFAKFIDPRFSSSFWRRVIAGEQL